MIRIGHGYDAHRLTEGRDLILGGVTIPFDRGLLGHSDADVLLHALSDAILGALALGDIGHLFPGYGRLDKGYVQHAYSGGMSSASRGTGVSPRKL